MKQYFYNLNIVKTRKDHKCVVCEEIIPKGTQTLVENGFNKPEGYFNNYFHRFSDKEHDCYNVYIDCMQPIQNIIDKIKDSEFHGQIKSVRWKE